jgi:hypothetical protein
LLVFSDGHHERDNVAAMVDHLVGVTSRPRS